jgi:hypothetical protein
MIRARQEGVALHQKFIGKISNGGLKAKIYYLSDFLLAFWVGSPDARHLCEPSTGLLFIMKICHNTNILNQSKQSIW